jgi:hypothetical protein
MVNASIHENEQPVVPANSFTSCGSNQLFTALVSPVFFFGGWMPFQIVVTVAQGYLSNHKPD